MIWQNFYIWEGPFSDRTESARFKAPIPTNQSGGIYTHEARTCYRTADSEPAGLHAAGQCPGGGGDVWCVCRRAGPDHDGGGRGGRRPNGKRRGYRRHPVCHPGGGGGPGGRGRHHPAAPRRGAGRLRPGQRPGSADAVQGLDSGRQRPYHPGEGGHIFCLRRQWHRPQPPQSSPEW